MFKKLLLTTSLLILFSTALFAQGFGSHEYVAPTVASLSVATGTLRTDLTTETANRTTQGLNRFSGVKVKPSFTVTGTTVTVGEAGIYTAYPTASAYSNIVSFTCSSQTFNCPTSLQSYYIVADYNNGSPIIRNTTDVNDIDGLQVIALWTITNIEGKLDYMSWGESGNGVAEKLLDRNVRTERFARENTGMILNVSSDPIVNCPSVSGGYVWHGSERKLYDNFDASTGDYDTMYRVAGVWTALETSSFSTTQYDDGDLKTLADGTYGIIYFWRCMGHDNDLYSVYSSTGYATEEQAREAAAPSAVPVRIASLALYVGKAVYLKGATDVTVYSAFDLSASGTAGVIEHNNTTGINGGSAGEYYHLTQTEHDNALLVGDSTASIQLSLNNVIISTGVIQTQVNSIAVDTGTLRTDLTSIQVSTGVLANDIAALKVSTGSIQTSLNDVIVSTGTLVKKSGDTMTGTLNGTAIVLTSSITFSNASVQTVAWAPVMTSSMSAAAININSVTDVYISTITQTQVGSKLFSLIGDIEINNAASADRTYTVSLYRGTTLLRTLTFTQNNGYTLNYPINWFNKASTAGSVTYTIRVKSSSATGTQTITGYAWRVIEQ